MVNSNQKGKRGEREWSLFCRGKGYTGVRRTQQYAGGTEESADCIGLPGIHQEVKRVEALNIYGAMEQAKTDCKGNKVPIVAHRKNNREWLVTMRADDWFALYCAWGKGVLDGESTTNGEGTDK